MDESTMTLFFASSQSVTDRYYGNRPQWVFVSSDPVDYKHMALCSELTSTWVPISRHARRRVLQGRNRPLEVKERGEEGRVRSHVAAEVVTEIACGRKRQIQTRGGEIS